MLFICFEILIFCCFELGFKNSILLKKALEDKKIPHLFVSYPEGGHGFGMKKDSDIMKKTSWNDKRLLPWLKEIGIL